MADDLASRPGLGLRVPWLSSRRPHGGEPGPRRVGKGRDGSPRDSHLPEPGTRAPEAENLAAAPAPVCTSAMRKPLQGSVFSLVKWEPQGCQGKVQGERRGGHKASAHGSWIVRLCPVLRLSFPPWTIQPWRAWLGSCHIYSMFFPSHNHHSHRKWTFNEHHQLECELSGL